jgi:hypothetical protein
VITRQSNHRIIHASVRNRHLYLLTPLVPHIPSIIKYLPPSPFLQVLRSNKFIALSDTGDDSWYGGENGGGGGVVCDGG